MKKIEEIPAIEGGKPVRDRYLPYGRQWLDESDRKAVLEILDGDYITTGPAITQFEEKVATYVGAKYAVAFANGTAALHAACFSAGIGKGDEVITTPMTFVATANAILYTRGTPVFADIDPNTYNINPDAIESRITERTKAILPVDFAGQPVNHEEIKRIAKMHQLVVIEDAAHALGATYNGVKIGSLSDMSVFSFHPVKPITTGEGGIITTNNETYYEKLIQFRTHGITRNPQRCSHFEGPWYYEMQFLGFNYRMTDFQAALGISQMNKLDRFNERRRKIASRYDAAFQNIKSIVIPQQLSNIESSWHLYVIRLIPERLCVDRKKIYEALQAENIGVNVHYRPVYTHLYYQQLGYQKGICPIAEKCYEQMITLPLFPAMTEQDIQDVIHAVRKVLNYYAK
jgi:perosamine synthetase